MSLTIQQDKENFSNWTDQFADAWEDARSAEEIIEDIRNARTDNLKRFRNIEGLEVENWIKKNDK